MKVFLKKVYFFPCETGRSPLVSAVSMEEKERNVNSHGGRRDFLPIGISHSSHAAHAIEEVAQRGN